MVLHMSVLVAIGIVGAGIACVFLAGLLYAQAITNHMQANPLKKRSTMC